VLNAFEITGLISLILFWSQLMLKLFAFIDVLRRKEQAFPAADKQTKKFWLIILGLALLADLVVGHPLGFLTILGTIAALVYVVDARPALAQVDGRGRSGPYGPY
jgi:hypothetical protein